MKNPNSNQVAVVYFDGGYIYSDATGLKGKHLAIQKLLIKALKEKSQSIVTSAGDELPVSYK